MTAFEDIVDAAHTLDQLVEAKDWDRICQFVGDWEVDTFKSIVDYYFEVRNPTDGALLVDRLLKVFFRAIIEERKRDARRQIATKAYWLVTNYVNEMKGHASTGWDQYWSSTYAAHRLHTDTWEKHVKIRELAKKVKSTNKDLSKTGIARILRNKHSVELSLDYLRKII